jgi:hypothetical protein
MKKKSAFVLGAINPILFFAFVYGISLLFALFTCRIVFFTLSGKDDVSEAKVVRYNIKSDVVQNRFTLKR